MKFLAEIKLKWLLLSGFMICAILTAVLGGTGIWSLRQMHQHMKTTTMEVEKTIDRQNTQIKRLMPLRNLISDIAAAQNTDALKEVNEKLKNIQESEVKDKNKKLAALWSLIQELLQQKEYQIELTRYLNKLLKNNTAELEKIQKLAINVGDNAEFNATLKIEDTIDSLRGNIKGMSPRQIQRQVDSISTSSGTSISSVRAALSIRSYSSDLNAKIYESQLTRDTAYLEYTAQEIDTLLTNLESSLKTLPNDAEAEKITAMLPSLGKQIQHIIRTQKSILASEIIIKDILLKIWQQMDFADDAIITAATNLKAEAEKTLESSSLEVKQLQTVEIILVLVALILAISIGILYPALSRHPLIML